MITVDPKGILNQFKGTLAQHFKVKILGIRGYELKGKRENTLGVYDDLICACIGDSVEPFAASTDPGWWYVNHPLNPLGCAKLQAGLWWYKVGMHRGHPSFVQAGAMTVDRIDPDGRKATQQTGEFGINLHSGGAEDEVGRWSAGCQVIRAPEGAWGHTWQRFFPPLQEAMKKFGQVQIPYLLVESLKADPVSV